VSPCRPLPDGLGIVCIKGTRSRPCSVRGCIRDGSRLCDFPTVPLAFGEPVQTCDRPLCATHATRVSRDQDYCPEHATAMRVR